MNDCNHFGHQLLPTSFYSILVKMGIFVKLTKGQQHEYLEQSLHNPQHRYNQLTFNLRYNLLRGCLQTFPRLLHQFILTIVGHGRNLKTKLVCSMAFLLFYCTGLRKRITEFMSSQQPEAKIMCFSIARKTKKYIKANASQSKSESQVHLKWIRNVLISMGLKLISLIFRASRGECIKDNDEGMILTTVNLLKSFWTNI